MSPTTIRFLKVGMAYFILGALLGTLLAVPVTRDLLYKAPGVQWRLAHTHLNLAGFVIMTIFGIAYHILPRFAGKPLHSESWAGCALLDRVPCYGGDGHRVHRSGGRPSPLDRKRGEICGDRSRGRQPLAHDPVISTGREGKGSSHV